MFKCPDNLQTASQRRAWLEEKLPIPPELKKSKAYQELSENAKIILMLMIQKHQKHRGGL